MPFHFPFEGNRNLSMTLSWFGDILMACDARSRLKGIETHTMNNAIGISASLRCDFPFEGNRNPCSSRSCAQTEIDHLRCAFPFEGNRNTFARPVLIVSFPPCDALSRLKGIETTFAVSDCHCACKTCDARSRLKGMETQASQRFFLLPQSPLWIRVPV